MLLSVVFVNSLKMCYRTTGHDSDEGSIVSSDLSFSLLIQEICILLGFLVVHIRTFIANSLENWIISMLQKFFTYPTTLKQHSLKVAAAIVPDVIFQGSGRMSAMSFLLWFLSMVPANLFSL